MDTGIIEETFLFLPFLGKKSIDLKIPENYNCQAEIYGGGFDLYFPLTSEGWVLPALVVTTIQKVAAKVGCTLEDVRLNPLATYFKEKESDTRYPVKGLNIKTTQETHFDEIYLNEYRPPQDMWGRNILNRFVIGSTIAFFYIKIKALPIEDPND